MTVRDENHDGEAAKLFVNKAGTEPQSRSMIDQSSSSQRTKQSECSSHRDLTVVSSLSSSSSSSREDIGSIVSVDGEPDEKDDDETEVFVSGIGSANNNTVEKDESETISELDEQWGSSPGATGRDHYENSDGCDDEANTDSLPGERNKSRPSRCEDFESDESEFEDDEILIVLRKKRKELIQKLWLIDEFINKKS